MPFDATFQVVLKFLAAHEGAISKFSFFRFMAPPGGELKKNKTIIRKTISDCTRGQSYKGFVQQENFPDFLSKSIRTYPMYETEGLKNIGTFH